MKKVSRDYLFWPSVIVAALAVFILSLWVGSKQSVWFDEAYSILLAKHSFGEIVRLTAEDVHPPVYYWILKLWMMVFGDGSMGLRSLSALFLALSVGGAGLLTRRMFGSRVAALTMPFLVFAPLLLRYGYEIRMYSLASLIGVVGSYVFLMAVQESRPRRQWALFGVYSLIVAVGVYTLYFLAFVWIAHLIWLTWRSYRLREWKKLLPAISAYCLSLLLFSPWLPAFLSRADGHTLAGASRLLNQDNLLGVFTISFLYRPWWSLSLLSKLAAIVILGAVVWVVIYGYRQARAKERQSIVFLIMYFLVPIGLLAVITYFLPVYRERYIAHFVVGLYILVGVSAGLSMRAGRKAVLIPVGLIAISLLIGSVNMAHYGNYSFNRLHRPVVDKAARLLECGDGAVIFANDPYVAIELGYYIKDCPVYFYSQSAKMGGGYAMLSHSSNRISNPSSQLSDAKKLFYVYYDKPKLLSIPNDLELKGISKMENLRVATYLHKQ